MVTAKRGTVLGAACLALLVGIAIGCDGCGGKSETKKVSLVGSTSVQPFAEVLAEQFNKANPDILVTVQGGGSSQGIASLKGGVADIGTCSRDLEGEEKNLYTPHVIARDGIAIVVNPKCKVEALTKQQVQDIFAGKIANWKEIGGEDHVIDVVLREDGSGTREAFTHLLMGKVECAKGAMVQSSNGQVKGLVQGNPFSIGYMSLGQVHGELKALPVDGMKPTEEGVAKGEYKLWRPFLFVTKGTPTPEAQKFIDFTLSPAGQKILEKEGLVGAGPAAASAPAATK